MFPGQGSQHLGMLDDNLKKLFNIHKNEINDSLGFNLMDIIDNGPIEDLNRTSITQPAILTTSVAILTVLKNEFNLKISDIKYFAGHSLGEYTALVASESLKFSDALHLVHNRGKLMQSAVPLGKGAMLAVMGLNIIELNSMLKKNEFVKGICEVANDNSPGQIIISGEKETLMDFSGKLKAEKRKSIFLPVSAPFHCSLMKPAAESMKKLLEKIVFRNPITKVVSNVTALPIEKEINIKDLLYRQIFSQVRWRESVEYMIKNNVNDFIEIGPGKVLSGLVKRTNDNVSTKSINKIEDMKIYNDKS